jgi:ABC-type amino acid transport substrate-binding protein
MNLEMTTSTVRNKKYSPVWLLLIILVIFFTFTQVGAGGLSFNEQDYLRKKGAITFVSQTHYPPFEFISADGDHIGMSIELVRWIATEYGFQIKLTHTSFNKAPDKPMS